MDTIGSESLPVITLEKEIDTIEIKKLLKSMWGTKTLPFDDTESFTHVQFDREAYLNTIEKENSLNRQIRALREDHEREVRGLTLTHQEDKEDLQEQHKEELQNMKQIALKWKKEAEHWKQANENLRRIARERSNAEQDLRPKRQHTGYALISADPFEYSFHYVDKYRKNRITKFNCWKVRYQTPHYATMEPQAVENLIRLEWKERLCELAGQVGIWSNDTIKGMEYDEFLEHWRTSSVIFRTVCRINGVKRCWDVEFLSTGPFRLIPDMMISEPLQKKGKKPKEKEEIPEEQHIFL